jgi:tetratricopeptide (TPR) repeat protein
MSANRRRRFLRMEQVRSEQEPQAGGSVSSSSPGAGILGFLASRRWLILSVVAALLAIAAFGVLWTRSRTTVSREIDVAARHFSRQEYDQAEAVLAKIREEHPRNTAALNLMARIYSSTGKSAQALECYGASIDVTRKQPETLFEYATYERLLGDSASAEKHFRWALEQDPSNSRYVDELARTLVSIGKGRDAAGLWEKMGGDSKQPKSTRVDAHVNAAVALKDSRDPTGAKKQLNAALKLAPDNWQAQALLQALSVP